MRINMDTQNKVIFFTSAKYQELFTQTGQQSILRIIQAVVWALFDL
jgi:hypothetical protein